MVPSYATNHMLFNNCETQNAYPHYTFRSLFLLPDRNFQSL